MIRSTRALLATLVLSLGLTACGSDSNLPMEPDPDPPQIGDPSGIYLLRTFAGTQMPVVLADEPGFKLVLVGGTVTLNANGTFTDVTVFLVTEGEEEEVEELAAAEGSWTRAGSVITFSGEDEQGPFTYAMVWNGSNQLTQDFEGLILVYTK